MKTQLRFRLAVWLLLLGCSSLAYAAVPQDSVKVKKVKEAPLFASDEVLRIKVVTDMRAVLKDRSGEESTYFPARLSYQEASGDSVELPVKVKTRGKFRRKATNCDLPPLLLNFAGKTTKKTVFDNQDKLKLVTRCREEGYILQEYLVYKMYNLLTDYSFKARLAHITYLDSAGKRKPESSFGFIIEDEDAMASRQNAKVRDKNTRTNMAVTDQEAMATVAVFEYMIGNTDWSVPYLHNIRILERERGQPIPVAYDFDHSGIVEARYAAPAPELDLRSTRDRMYRGLNYSEELFNKVFANFNQNKTKIYALYENNPNLNAAYAKRTLKYLDQFYEIINKPALARSVFMNGKSNQTIQIGGLKAGG
jgi:hypothetical protein